MSKSRLSAKKLALTAVLMAMNIIMSMSIFSIPVPGGHMYLNDLIICTAAILLDPFCAFMVGGVGRHAVLSRAHVCLPGVPWPAGCDHLRLHPPAD